MYVSIITPSNPVSADGLHIFKEAQILGYLTYLIPKEIGDAGVLSALNNQKPDWVFYCGLPTDTKQLMEVKKRCGHLLIWYPDSINERRLHWLMNLEKIPDIVVCAHKNIISTIGRMIFDGNAYLPKCIYLPHYFNQHFYKYDGPPFKMQYEACFVGNDYMGQEAKRVKWLRELQKYFHIGIMGDGFRTDMGKSQNYDGAEVAKMFQSSKLGLDIWWDDDFVEYGELDFSVRVFKQMGCGLFTITPYVKELEKLFKPNIHLAVYNGHDLKNLMDTITYWLDPISETRRKEIAYAGQQLVLREHTITERVQQYWTLMRGLS